MSIFETLAKEAKNEYAKVVSETNNKQCFVGTGSYILNAMISGSINGGIPDNRITAIAGEQATGKTFYAIGIAQHFLETNPVDKISGVGDVIIKSIKDINLNKIKTNPNKIYISMFKVSLYYQIFRYELERYY